MLETRARNIATDADTRLMTGQKNILESISKMNNEQVEDDLPAAKENAETAIDEVRTQLNSVAEALHKSRDKLGQERVMKEANSMRATLEQEISDAAVDVDQQKE